MTEKTPGLRSLSYALKRLREAAGLSREDVIAQSPVSKSTLRRAENVEARPNRSTLHILLTLYKADDATRAEIDAMWEEAGKQDFLRPFHSDLRRDYKAWIACEDQAAQVRSYESSFITGLGQTRDYAAAVIQGVWPSATPTDLDHHVQARMERQAVLTRPEPITFTAIMDEATLHRVVGGPLVMVEQMRHLQTLAELPHVTLRVIPWAGGAHPGMPGCFAVANFAQASPPAVVYIDGMAGDVLLDSEQDVEHYSGTFTALEAVALNPDDSLALIADRAREFSHELETTA